MNPLLTAQPTDSTCTKSAKQAVINVLEAAANKGGELLYNALATAYNTFINLIQQEANAVVAVIEPLLTLDQFIFDNFVKPPLDSALSLVTTIQQTIKVPAQAIGATSGACNQESGNRTAVQKIEDFLTRDAGALKNKLDNYQYHSVISEKTLAALKALPSYMDKLRAPSYADFKAFLAAL